MSEACEREVGFLIEEEQSPTARNLPSPLCSRNLSKVLEQPWNTLPYLLYYRIALFRLLTQAPFDAPRVIKFSDLASVRNRQTQHKRATLADCCFSPTVRAQFNLVMTRCYKSVALLTLTAIKFTQLHHESFDQRNSSCSNHGSIRMGACEAEI